MRIYHGADLRRGRFSETDRPYLITTVTRDRRPLFRDWQVGRLLVAQLRAATENGHAETIAWVVMPDHLHWLMAPGAEDVDAAIRRVKSQSARTVNQRMGTTGALWQKGYHDHALRNDEDIRAVARYVIANPLRAGIVSHIGDYHLAVAAGHALAKMFAAKAAPTKPSQHASRPTMPPPVGAGLPANRRGANLFAAKAAPTPPECAC